MFVDSMTGRPQTSTLSPATTRFGSAYLLWYRGVQRLGNSRTAVYSNLVPVAALITAWIWLGEVPTGPQIAGAGVILVGLSVARLAQSPEPS